jgi:hypothetical protein
VNEKEDDTSLKIETKKVITKNKNNGRVID